MKILPTTSELIKKYQLQTKKSLGQNFILDKNFTDKIARLGGNLSQYEVLEIGAGPGGLSRSILDCGAKKLVVIEKDRRCILALQELKEFYGDRLEIIADDALRIDETKIFDSNKKFKIIANLPYNIGTALIFKWLKILPKIESMHLMLQKEVVQRIVAKTGDNHYGRLAVMINLLCETKLSFLVNKSVFIPPPKVDSAIVEIIPSIAKINKYNDQNLLKNFEMIVSQAFNQRRKMLKSSLKNYLIQQQIPKDRVEDFFRKLDIDPSLRAEQITIEQFWKISQN
ncbi:MAG: 16S rRNA (adenine(1518)-N(6)/adenine(1519)-N(6))-dimethyltransferase RsmA [Alphaproteobacteria bacterium]|nr:16S rRNA (adenine(1518)-N(6)/adenine(1519)-N(6))-dimethyltransferase RsmA [Alphaproteobacteria bacterium]